MIWLDGKFVADTDATITMFDEAVLHGVAAFETMRTYKGELFEEQAHLDRLWRTLEAQRIPPPMSHAGMKSVCRGVMERNPVPAGDEHRLLILVTPGVLPIYEEADHGRLGTRCAIADVPCRRTTHGCGRAMRHGVGTVDSEVRQSTFLPRHKTTHRAHLRLAQRLAGDAWPLLHDELGCLAEAPGANLIVYHEGTLVSPREHCLEGISVRVAMKLAHDLPIPARWGAVTPHMLRHAEEAMLTGTPFGILPVTSYNGAPVGSGKPGPVFQRLVRAWSEKVGVDMLKQLEEWDAERPVTA